MPKIEQYNAPIEGFRPSDKGANAAAELAQVTRVYSHQTAAALKETGQALDRGLSDLGKGVKDWEDKAKQAKELEELSNLNAASEDLQFKQRQEYNEFAKTADLKDLDAVKAFSQTQDQAWRDLAGKVSTPKGKMHLETLRHQQRLHNLNTLAADQVIQTQANIERDRNTRWTAATADMVNDPSPSNVASILERQRMKTEIELSSADVPPKTREAILNHENTQMNKVLTEAAAAFIRKSPDPNQAYKYVAEQTDGNPYYGRVDNLKLRGFADAEINRRETQINVAERRQEHNDRKQIDSGQAKILLDSIQADGKVVVPENALEEFKTMFDKNPNLINSAKPGEIKSFIDNIKQLANNPDTYILKPNADRMTEIQEKIANGEAITVAEIWKGAGKDYNTQFAKQMITELRQNNAAIQTPEFKASLAGVKEELVKRTFNNMPINDPVGKQNYANFMGTFMPAYRARVAKGENEPNDLNAQDPDSYIAKAMAPYKRTWQQQQQDMMDAIKGDRQKAAIDKVNPAATATRPVTAIELAESQVGMGEVKDRSALTAFFQVAGGSAAKIDPATTPWCAAWASAVLKVTGHDAPNTAAARGFLSGGQPIADISKAQKGDIVVFARGNSPSQGHVGFYAGPGDTPGTIKLLAGNQGNKVSIVERSTEGMLGIRRYSQKDIVGVTPPGGPMQPAGTISVPDTLKKIPNLGYNSKTGEYYDPGSKTFYNTDGTPKVTVPISR